MCIKKQKKIRVPGGLGNAIPATVVKGIIFTSDSGINQVGTAEGSSAEPILQEKTATENGTVTADAGYDGLSKVDVNVPIPDGYIKPEGRITLRENTIFNVTNYATAVVEVPETIPDGYVKPEGSVTITENSTVDVTDKAEVVVNVPIPEAPEVTTEEAAVIPSEETQTVTPTDADYLSKVIVHPIPDLYVIPEGEVSITENGEHDVSGKKTAKVNIPAVIPVTELPTENIDTSAVYSMNGKLYRCKADLTGTTWKIPKGWSVEAGFGKFTITGTIKNLYSSTNPTHTFSTEHNTPFMLGYYSGTARKDYLTYISNTNSTSLINSPSPFTITITGGTDVGHPDLIKWLDTNGELQSGGVYEWVEYLAPEGELEITANGTHDVKDKASVVVNVPSVAPALEELTATANGEYTPSGDGFSKVIVAVPEVPEWDPSNFTITRAIKDLTDTTWEISAEWAAEAGLGQFEVDCTYEGETYNRFGVGYGWEASLQAPFPFNNFALLYNDGTTEYAKMSSSNAYIISITGGKDAKNTDLIGWMQKYGKEVGTGTGTSLTLSGTWLIDALPIAPSEQIDQNVNFTSNGVSYTSISIIPDASSEYPDIVYGDVPVFTCGYGVEDPAWADEGCRTVDFGETEQEVSEEFYDAFTATAVKVISFTIDGTSYTAEEGMTWADWIVVTEYNEANASISDNFIVIDGKYVSEADGVQAVYTTTPIVSGYAYTLPEMTSD